MNNADNKENGLRQYLTPRNILIALILLAIAWYYYSRPQYVATLTNMPVMSELTAMSPAAPTA